MSIADKFRAILPGKRPVEQLGQIRERIGLVETEIAWLDGEIDRLAIAEMHQDQDAIRIRAGHRQHKAELAEILQTLRAAEVDRARAVAAEDAAKRQAEADAKPAKIVAAVAAVFAADDRIDLHARALREAMDGAKAAKAELAELIDNEQLRRANQVAYQQAAGAIAQLFEIAVANGGRHGSVNLLGLKSPWIGERTRLSLRDLDQEMLDDLAPCYPTREAAEAAQQRLAARHTPTTVVAAGPSSWTLARHDHLFVERAEADRAAAAAARIGQKLVVVPNPPGWRLIPTYLAAGEAA